jgi:hypothetical protein
MAPDSRTQIMFRVLAGEYPPEAMRRHLSALLLATYPAGTPIAAIAQDMQPINDTGLISTPHKSGIPRTPKADVEEELLKFCVSFAQSVEYAEPAGNPDLSDTTPRPAKRNFSAFKSDGDKHSESPTVNSDASIRPLSFTSHS